MKDWQKEFILKNRDSMTYTDMGRVISVSKSEISSFLRSKGIHKYKLTNLSADEMQYIITAFDNGVTYSEMAEHLGVQVSALAKFLNNLGFTRYKMKNPGRVQRIQQAKRVSHSEFVEIKKNAYSDKALLQAKALRKTSKKRWELSEDSLLLSLNAKGVSVSIIAVKLNRSDIAVKARIYKLLNK